jgi:leader peptidase (prepilin peptidase)/N-methyltransferase
MTAAPLCLLASALLSLSYIDLKFLLLPDTITLPLLWFGLLWNSTRYGLPTLESAVWGAAFGYFLLWSANSLFRFLRKRDGMGYGDFKLIAALGAWGGWEGIQFILVTSPIIGIIYWLIFRKRLTDGLIPFGPMLILAAACYFLLFQRVEVIPF